MSELSEAIHLKMEQSLINEDLSLEQFMVILCAASAIKLMTGDREEAYNNGGLEIKDYWDDLGDSFQMMKMKLLRAKSLSAKLISNNKNKGKTLMELTDSCVDLINYTGFHLANAIRSTGSERTIRQITNKYQAHDIFIALVDQVQDTEKNNGE